MKNTISNSSKLVSILVSFITSCVLTACQASLPAGATQHSSSTSLPSTSLLTLSPAQSTVASGASTQMSTTGGTPPFLFYLTGSTNSLINTSTGLFNAGLATETVQVLVKDANGMTAVTSIQVNAAPGVVVNIYRSYNTSNGDHLYSRDVNEGPHAGYVNEGAVFAVYPTQGSGTAPLYRCANGLTGQHLLSLNTNCDGQGSLEGAIGYVSGAASNAETIQLYRFVLASPSAAMYLETTNINEGSAAGFTYEGPLGYVAPAI